MPWLPSTLIPRRPGCTCRELGRVPRGCRASGRGAPKSQCDSVPRSSGEDPTNAGRAITESRAGPFTRGSTGSVSTCPEERSAVYAGRSWTALGSPVQHAARVVLAAMLVHVAPLAQLAEQLALNQRVRGSSPWRRTTHPRRSPAGVFSHVEVRGHPPQVGIVGEAANRQDRHRSASGRHHASVPERHGDMAVPVTDRARPDDQGTRWRDRVCVVQMRRGLRPHQVR